MALTNGCGVARSGTTTLNLISFPVEGFMPSLGLGKNTAFRLIVDVAKFMPNLKKSIALENQSDLLTLEEKRRLDCLEPRVCQLLRLLSFYTLWEIKNEI